MDWLKDDTDETLDDELSFNGVPVKLPREIRTRSSEIYGFLPASFKTHGWKYVLADVQGRRGRWCKSRASNLQLSYTSLCQAINESTIQSQRACSMLTKVLRCCGMRHNSFRHSDRVGEAMVLARKHDRAFVVRAIECIVLLHEHEVRSSNFCGLLVLDEILELILQTTGLIQDRQLSLAVIQLLLRIDEYRHEGSISRLLKTSLNLLPCRDVVKALSTMMTGIEMAYYIPEVCVLANLPWSAATEDDLLDLLLPLNYDRLAPKDLSAKYSCCMVCAQAVYQRVPFILVLCARRRPAATAAEWCHAVSTPQSGTFDKCAPLVARYSTIREWVTMTSACTWFGRISKCPLCAQVPTIFNYSQVKFCLDDCDRRQREHTGTR